MEIIPSGRAPLVVERPYLATEKSRTSPHDEFADSSASPIHSHAAFWYSPSQLRDRFNEVTAQFEVLDKLVLQFGQTTAGRDFVAAYQSARLIRSTGGPTARTKQDQPEEAVGTA